ncbi:MAG TPA: lamin tail domain-containing protein [Candidatus Saccharimonadales bacterium]
MQKILTRVLCSCLSAVLFVLAPSSTLADGASTNDIASPPVLITELQTGSSTSGKDEFIELYNDSAASVDITNWQVRYVSSSSSSASLSAPTQTITISPASNNKEMILPAGSYFVLRTSTVALPADVPGQVYTYTLPASGGSVALLEPNAATCELSVEDAVAWGSGTFGQGTPIATTSKDVDYQRYIGPDGNYLETYDSATDFGTSSATPGSTNTLRTTDASAGGITPPIATTIPDASCTLPGANSGDGSGATDTDGSSQDGDQPGNNNDGLQDPTDGAAPPVVTTASGSSATGSGSEQSTATTSGLPAADVGLVSPQLTELLPNPASPQTDAEDEFVELYNANGVPFDLSNFKLVAGQTTTHTYTFPANTTLAPRSFTAFFSADTRLSLSNDGGKVALEDPNGDVLNQTAPYSTAKDGEAWALALGAWAWTTTPTPNAPNEIVAPATATAKTTKASTTAAKKTTAKSVATKASSKTKAASTAKNTPSASLDASTTPTPIHAGVLAFAALFALLYGAYEYRRDVANRFHQLRSYRSARREARASLARWRSG